MKIPHGATESTWTTKSFQCYCEWKFISSESITRIIWFDMSFVNLSFVCNSFFRLFLLLRDISVDILCLLFFSLVNAHYILLLQPLLNFIVSSVPTEKGPPSVLQVPQEYYSNNKTSRWAIVKQTWKKFNRAKIWKAHGKKELLMSSMKFMGFLIAIKERKKYLNFKAIISSGLVIKWKEISFFLLGKEKKTLKW